MGNWEMEIPNCVPEYFREQEEKYNRECELALEMHEHYKANRKKLEDAEKAGYPILKYDGYNACSGCGYADFDTQCFDFDDIGLVICKNPDCPEHRRHQTESN